MTKEPAAASVLDSPPVRSVLDRLHRAAGADIPSIIAALPGTARAVARDGLSALGPAMFRTSYLAVSPEQGRFMYVLARAIAAKRIVEFGTSYGISTIYLAAAVRESRGMVVGTEMDEAKCETARANLRDAGLAAHADIRLGDALATLADVPAPVDFVLLDGWKELNLPVLELLLPKLRPGSVVLADDIFRFRKAMAPYVRLMQSGQNGFRSTSVAIGGGFEFSVFEG